MKTKSKRIIYAAFILLSMGGIAIIALPNLFIKHEANGNLESIAAIYHCPMHPHVVSHEPGQCPICGMDLVLVESDNSHQDEKPNSDEASDAKTLFGRSSFSLSDDAQQKIGVSSKFVAKRKLFHEIRATGRVAFDPELYAVIEEYRQALNTSRELGATSYPGIKAQANALVASSKTKLKLMGLTNDQILKISQGGSNPLNLLLPMGKVWVYAEVFEYEIGGVKPGQRIEAEAPSIPGQVFKGEISSISPVLNAQARTIRVRAEVPDPEGLLRPDTFLNVKILNDLGEKLALPVDAVLHSGTESYVFVIKDLNKFEPKPVTLGVKSDSYYEVLAGLTEGEKVVTGASFLIDSESRLKSVLMQKSPDNIKHQGHEESND